MKLKIKLTKKEAVLGALPVGHELEIRIPERFAGSEFDAHSFANGVLKRDHPDENPMCWDREIVTEPTGFVGQ